MAQKKKKQHTHTREIETDYVKLEKKIVPKTQGIRTPTGKKLGKGQEQMWGNESGRAVLFYPISDQGREVKARR